MLLDGEAAWSGEAEPSKEQVFRPVLLVDSEVAVLAGIRDGRVIAGVVATRAIA